MRFIKFKLICCKNNFSTKKKLYTLIKIRLPHFYYVYMLFNICKWRCSSIELMSILVFLPVFRVIWTWNICFKQDKNILRSYILDWSVTENKEWLICFTNVAISNSRLYKNINKKYYTCIVIMSLKYGI